MATTTTATAAPRSFLIDRIKLVLTCPATCWQTIASESRSPRELFTTISLPLLALGAVAGFVGLKFFSAPSSTAATALLLQQSLLAFLLSCAMPFVSALVLRQLAPFFQGTVESNRAFSWSVHSSIPMLVASLLNIIPLFGQVGGIVAACWSLYSGYAGLPVMAAVPKNQQLALFISYIIAVAILFVLLALAAAGLFAALAA
jgi:hypothetical protein